MSHQRQLRKFIPTLKFSMIIDEEDKHRVSQYSWFLTNGYITAYIDGKLVYLHRYIMGATSDKVVDHRNKIVWDCRKSNLRLCSQADNLCNKTKTTKKTTSKYKGVYFDGKLFKVSIKRAGVRKYIGSFSDERLAGIAYNLAAVKLHGEFASLNIIEEVLS